MDVATLVGYVLKALKISDATPSIPVRECPKKFSLKTEK